MEKIIFNFTVIAFATLLIFSPTTFAQQKHKKLSPLFEIDKERKPFNRATRPQAKSYMGPIIDVHSHIFDRRNQLDFDKIIAEMDKSGVTRIFVMPTPNEGRYIEKEDNATARRMFNRIANKRAGRFCGSTYLTAWMNRTFREGYEPSDLKQRLLLLKSDITLGGCLGDGEIGPYHFEKRLGQWVLNFKMNFKPMIELVQLVARLDVWLDLHAEPVNPEGISYEAEVFGGINYLFQKAPNLKVILAHTGMTNAQNAERLMVMHPNLMMHLKFKRPNRNLSWNKLGPLMNEKKKLFEDWAQLFEAMPNRFMVGMDARFGSNRYSYSKYSRKIRQVRKLLGSLDPKAAKLIAWQNASQLWPLK